MKDFLCSTKLFYKTYHESNYLLYLGSKRNPEFEISVDVGYTHIETFEDEQAEIPEQYYPHIRK